MKTFKELLCETKLYRGVGAKDKDYNRDSPFVWFTLDKDFAEEYARTNLSTRASREGRVVSIDYSLKNTADLRDADRRIPVSSFLAELMKQSSVNFKNIKDQGMQLRKDIINEFGSKADYIHQFWQSQKVAEFVDLLGFDSVKALESGKKTVGILQNKL